jgi:hypothetical protein
MECDRTPSIQLANRMLFMIRMSFELLSHTAAWPMLWGAIAFVLAAGLLAQRHRRHAAVLSPTRWSCEMTALAAGPLCMLVWGWYVWPPNGGYSPHESAAERVLECMALASIAVAAALVWRHRRRPRRTVAVATFSLWWAAAAFTTAMMAVRNSWP